jgi:signal transduction histidine kinase
MNNRKYTYLFIAFIIVQFFAWFLVIEYNNLKVEELKKNELKIIQKQYISILETFEKLANTVFDGYINTPNIVKYMKNNQRDKLYMELKDDYKYLSSIDFKQIHFHTKNNISFLRMHKLNKFGDDLTKYRYSVNYVNTNKKSINGLELGRILPGFRFVYPLFDTNHQHIGSVETSYGIDAFTKNIKDMYGVRTNFIINKDLIQGEIFLSSAKYYANSIESDNYVLLKQSVDPKILKNLKILSKVYDDGLKEKIKERIALKKPFNVSQIIANTYRIITFLPVKDIQNNHLGYFVIYKRSYDMTEYSKALTSKQIIAFIIIFGLFFFIFRELRHKDTLRQDIKEKTKKLQETTVQIEEHAIELENKIKLEVEKNAKYERDMFQQSKQAALGDMIANIAHQWRQPLSAISTSASGMQVTYQIDALDKEDFINYTDAIIENAQYLSRTIDDFRDFVKSEKNITRFDVSKSIEKCMAIINSSINNHNLNIQLDLAENLIVNNYDNELQQAIINIFNNAKDVLKEKVSNDEDRIIFIKTYKHNNTVVISIKDTAGGISFDIMEKIFEPYFTTKHQSQGTGLGLYMTQQIIVESMKGNINVENVTFSYNEKSYTGAQFSIILPIN